jgi:rod shape-determining protein MreC
MQNLIRFILRYWLFIFFLAIESFCFYLIYTNSQFHEALLFNKANQVSGDLYAAYTASTDYLTLGKVNDSLASENALLRRKNIEAVQIINNTQQEIRDTSGEVVQVFSYRSAKVIKNSVNQAANYIYLNKGSKHGIKPQMGVICDKGIVGQVVNVTENYAAVMSVLNKNFRVSAKMKNSDYFGQLFWNGRSISEVRLEEIPKHVLVQVGDTVVTSGYSILFPENIMIGKVTKVYSQPEKTFLEIDVKLSAPLSNLGYVYVVDHLYKNELIQLDSLTQNKTK